MKWWLLVLPLSALTLFGCEDSVSGFLSCGIDVCSAREECVETSSGPACLCAAGFEGSGCGTCASGYERISANECRLIPIDCQDNPTVCGLHGVCADKSSGDVCDCDDLYAGRLCELCESGYQDNDSDGICRATCAQADLDCKAPSHCSDARGTAICDCPAGYTGDDCSRCALGYRDTGTACVATCAASVSSCSRNQVCVDLPKGARCECAEGYAGADCGGCAQGYREDTSTGSCLPSCEGAGAACGEHGHCDDSVGFARCVCDLGHTDSSCDACADDFEAESGGQCVRTLGGDETLVMLASYQSRSVLSTLNPVTGAALPLAEVEASGLASGGDPQTVFLNQSGKLVQLKLPGETVPLAIASSGAVGPLAWDPGLGRIYALGGKAPYPVLSIDPSTKVVVELFDTDLAGVSELSFDAEQNRLLALRDTLYQISLIDGAVTEVGALPPATVGLEVMEQGGLLALATTDVDEAASRVNACRATASRLGMAGFASATGRFSQPTAAVATARIEAVSSDTPEVLSYLGRGGSGALRTVEIAVQNPQAFLCLAIEEPTLVHVADDASFRALVIYAADAEVELVTVAKLAKAPNVLLGGYAPHFTFPERDDVSQYTPQEWATLELPLDMRFYRPGPGVLHRLDATLTVVSSTTLTGASIPAGALSPWTPVP